MEQWDKSDWRFIFDENRFGKSDRAHAGWRIESQYSPGVLVNNWSEERYAFLKYPHGPIKHRSAYDIEYTPFDVKIHGPDVVQRRRGRIRNEGLPLAIVTHHHGDEYLNNNVTLYDENYNGRWREKNLPPLRTWNSRNISWVPERSDFHVKTGPTNFGLLAKKKEQWRQQQERLNKGDYATIYNDAYTDFDPSSYKNKRFGFDKATSISLQPNNALLKDIKLRGETCLKVPETVVFPERTLPKITS